MAKKFTKISFKKGGDKGVKISYNTFEKNELKDETDKNGKHPPHQTFIDAMQRLKRHAMLITEYNGATADKFKTLDKFVPTEAEEKQIRIVGISLSGEDEKAGVIITIYRTLSTGKGYAFNTPLELLNSESETAYKFASELDADITAVQKEADEYLKGKYGVVQGELFNEGEPAPQD